MRDAAEIARGLSKAQKKALMWLPGNGSTRQIGTPSAPIWPTMRALQVRGLIDRDWAVLDGWRALQFGLQVRAALQQQEPGDGR